MKITNSEEETKTLAFDLAAKAKGGDIFCLSGEMASGKTVFAKGFAKGLEVEDLIASPTFTILGEYDGRIKFYHFDVYRLDGNFDDFVEYLYAGGVCLIEWADLIKPYIPQNAVWIEIMKNHAGENVRRIIFRSGADNI
jgi:tRNA threonylcarbamoyladenosine biosynthesis protein TsaE